MDEAKSKLKLSLESMNYFLQSFSNDNILISDMQSNLIIGFAAHLEECSLIEDPYETALVHLLLKNDGGTRRQRLLPRTSVSEVFQHPTNAQSGLDPVWPASIDTPSWPNPEKCIMWNPTNAEHTYRSVCVVLC